MMLDGPLLSSLFARWSYCCHENRFCIDCNPVCQYLDGNTYLQQWHRFITPNLTNYHELYLSARGTGITMALFNYIHTLSGRIVMAASHAERCSFDSQQRLHRFILCTRRSGVLPMRVGGCNQSIRSTVSYAIVRIWLWSTATSSSPLGYFSMLLQVWLIIDPTFSGSWFSTGRLLAIEDFTFYSWLNINTPTIH